MNDRALISEVSQRGQGHNQASKFRRLDFDFLRVLGGSVFQYNRFEILHAGPIGFLKHRVTEDTEEMPQYLIRKRLVIYFLCSPPTLLKGDGGTQLVVDQPATRESTGMAGSKTLHR